MKSPFVLTAVLAGTAAAMTVALTQASGASTGEARSVVSPSGLQCNGAKSTTSFFVAGGEMTDDRAVEAAKSMGNELRKSQGWGGSNSVGVRVSESATTEDRSNAPLEFEISLEGETRTRAKVTFEPVGNGLFQLAGLEECK